ncbi:hypothetical protein BWI15_00575 [Kribbella sp. ALI-6-A]|uniref:choice-of-anchor D domain-containing protein n=1 Tax=Kribbella sp. ALI-6-A TaxID=1933817 RepID=UPI00097C6010|nr:choice-of-anchor D domain-containing protein [Kribbella sp. ALI-6-A]ONI78408.1 hypothetical protein BWI15_00575 [Kribbella sp. ALI-6-A]
MRRAFRRYALAAAIAAITVPFVAHAAAGEEAPPVPTAQVFPTRTGMGITWSDVDASAYRIERKQGSADWQNASGELASTATSWIDSSLTAGTTAEYRVVAAHSGDEIATSPSVTATRVAQDPAVGDVDVLVLDADPGDGTTWLRNEIAGPVTVSAPADGYRTLSAGTLKLRMPAFLAGPGNYSLGQSQFSVTQGERSCSTSGTLTVSAVTYTPALELETMAAAFNGWSCAGVESGLTVDLRIRSAQNYQALTVSPSELPAVQVRSGQTAVLPAVTVKNTGTAPVEIEKVEFTSGMPSAWKITTNDCPAVLPVAAACTVKISFAPNFTGLSRAKILVSDSTSRGWHTVLASGTGTDLPSAHHVTVTSTFTGNVVRWTALSTSGGTPVRGYWLHSFVDGAETTRWHDAVGRTGDFVVVDSDPPAGIEYAVSVVNEIGEGPTGPPAKAGRATEQIALSNGDPRRSGLMAADLRGQVVSFPGTDSSVDANGAVTSSPDGRSVAYVTSDRSLWTRRVEPGGLGTPVKVLDSSVQITHLSWSPDGTRLAFQAPAPEAVDVPCVHVVSASGGVPERIACDVSSPSWLPDARTLAVIDGRADSSSGDPVVVVVQAQSGGAFVRSLGRTAEHGTPLRVSPDGRNVGLGAGLGLTVISMESHTTSSIQLGGDVRAISWAPDGTKVLVLGAGGGLTNVTVSGTGGEPALKTPVLLTPITTHHAQDIAWQRLGPVFGPSPAVQGSRVSLSYDGSALMPGTTFACSAPGAVAHSCANPMTATFTSSGTYTLGLIATEPDGRVSRAFRTVTVDAAGPASQLVAPTVEATTSGTAAVKYSATDSAGVASYDVRYRKASYLSGFGAYVQPWTGTTATSVSLPLDAGYEYCVSVRAKDKLGNLGAWSAEKCFSRPLDDRAMGAPTAGWSRTSWSEFYLGTATQTTAYGASLTRTVQGKRFFLVATKCPTCGLVAVYAGGKYIGAVNLASATTQRQAIVALPVQSAVFSGTLTFTVRSATGKFVQIDGLAVRRT